MRKRPTIEVDFVAWDTQRTTARRIGEEIAAGLTGACVVREPRLFSRREQRPEAALAATSSSGEVLIVSTHGYESSPLEITNGPGRSPVLIDEMFPAGSLAHVRLLLLMVCFQDDITPWRNATPEATIVHTPDEAKNNHLARVGIQVISAYAAGQCIDIVGWHTAPVS